MRKGRSRRPTNPRSGGSAGAGQHDDGDDEGEASQPERACDRGEDDGFEPRSPGRIPANPTTRNDEAGDHRWQRGQEEPECEHVHHDIGQAIHSFGGIIFGEDHKVSPRGWPREGEGEEDQRDRQPESSRRVRYFRRVASKVSRGSSVASSDSTCDERFKASRGRVETGRTKARPDARSRRVLSWAGFSRLRRLGSSSEAGAVARGCRAGS